MKLYILFLLGITLPLVAQTKQTEGIISDAKGNLLEGVFVSVKNSNKGTTTDSKGFYTIATNENDWLIFSYLGCKKTEKQANGKRMDIRLEDDFLQLSQVVVTGEFVPSSSEKALHKIQTISEENIRKRGATNMEGVMKTIGGFRMKADNLLGETDFELMGVGGNSVKILLDGIPLLDRAENKQSLSQIDINTIERIEIVEGPMSVLYGSDALAGVVNIITKKENIAVNSLKTSISIHEENIGNEYRFGYGQGLHRQNVNLSYRNKTNLSASGGISFLNNGGWKGQRKERSLEWNPKEQTMLNASVGYQKETWNARYHFDFTSEELKVAGDWYSRTYTEDQRLASARQNHRLHLFFFPSKSWKFENASSVQNYRRNTFEWRVNRNGNEEIRENETPKDDTHFSLIFNRLTALYFPMEKLKIQAGYEISVDFGRGSRIDRERSVQSHSIFTSAEYNLTKKWLLRAGLRSDIHTNYSSQRFFIPSINMKYQIIDNLNVRLSYAEGFRVPKLRELYFNFYDSNHDIIGNPELKPEKSQNFSGGISYLFTYDNFNISSAVNGFYNRFSDRILMMASQTKNGQFTYGNIGAYRTAGATWKTELKHKNLTADATLAMIGRYMIFDDSVSEANQLNQFRYSPEITLSAQYFIEKWKTDVSFFYKYTGKRYDYYTDSLMKFVLEGNEAFHWADASLGKHFGKHLYLQAGVKNIGGITSIFDNSPGGHASGAMRFIGSGRNYFCSFNVNF